MQTTERTEAVDVAKAKYENGPRRIMKTHFMKAVTEMNEEMEKPNAVLRRLGVDHRPLPEGKTRARIACDWLKSLDLNDSLGQHLRFIMFAGHGQG